VLGALLSRIPKSKTAGAALLVLEAPLVLGTGGGCTVILVRGTSLLLK
jgi:hypothetical protein